MSVGIPFLCFSMLLTSFSEAYDLVKGAIVSCMVIVKPYVALPRDFSCTTNNFPICPAS